MSAASEGAVRLAMDGADVHQQRMVAQVAALGSTCPAHKVLLVSGHADLEHPALHRDRPRAPVALDEGVLRCLCEVRRRFSQDVALHLHARQFGPQSADFHLLSTHNLAVSAFELALPVRVTLGQTEAIGSGPPAPRR